MREALGAAVALFAGTYIAVAATPPATPTPAPDGAAIDARASVTPASWRILEPGLELGVFPSARRAADGSPAQEDPIRVLRIDPSRFEFRLLNASAEPGAGRLTARDWCVRHDLTAAINASMYQTDLRTSVSLMRSRAHVNNPHLTRDKAVLAFDPLDPGVPGVQIIDRECHDFDALRARYGALVQSIRMVSCTGRNVWSPQPRAFSTAAIGMDDQGRALFIHARAPYPTHDLIAALLTLPIGLTSAMYAEGGSEAQLAIHTAGEVMEFVGLRSGSSSAAGAVAARPIPNVIGVVRREGALK